jgi:hypothetical protein
MTDAAIERERTTSTPRFARAVLAGFSATAAMTATLLLAYTIMANLSLVLPNTQLGTWFAAMTNNTVVDLTRGSFVAALMFHLAMGIGLALLYAYAAERVLPGRDWQRGVIFAFIPYILSLVVFFPVTGAGFFGMNIGAGPLPALGNLILHLVYGATLGTVYGRVGDQGDWRGAGLDRTAELSGQQARAEARFEKGAAIGLLLGAVLGTAIGYVGGSRIDQMPTGLPVLEPWTYALAGGFLGTAIGTLIGSFVAMTPPRGETRDAAVRNITMRQRPHLPPRTTLRRDRTGRTDDDRRSA